MTALDRETFTGSIGDTNSETLEASASQSSRAHLFIDDGTTDNSPATYDLVVRAYSPDLGRFQFAWTETGRTDRSWDWPASGSTLQVEVTNQSGGSATYDITLETRER